MWDLAGIFVGGGNHRKYAHGNEKLLSLEILKVACGERGGLLSFAPGQKALHHDCQGQFPESGSGRCLFANLRAAGDAKDCGQEGVLYAGVAYGRVVWTDYGSKYGGFSGEDLFGCQIVSLDEQVKVLASPGLYVPEEKI